MRANVRIDCRLHKNMAADGTHDTRGWSANTAWGHNPAGEPRGPQTFGHALGSSPQRESDRAKRASGAYWGASGAPLFGAGERGRIKNIRGRCSMRRGILYSTAAPDIFYSASFARKPGSPVSERREASFPPRPSANFFHRHGDIHIVVFALKCRTRSTHSLADLELSSWHRPSISAASPSAARCD